MAVLALFFLFVVPARARQGGGMPARLEGLAVEQINQKGGACLERGDVDSAMAYFTVAAGRYAEGMGRAGKHACVDALNNIGAIKFFYRNDYISAFSYLIKGLKIADETGYDAVKPKIYVNLAGVHTIFGDSAVAARLMGEAFRVSKEQRDWYIYVASFIDLASHLAVNGNLGGMRGEVADFKSADVPDSIKMRDYARWLCRGVELYNKRRYDDCLEAFDSAAARVEPDLQSATYLSIADMLAAKAYAAKGMYATAIGRIKAGMSPSMTMYSRYISYKALAAYYAETGAADSARAYRMKYLLINDTTLSYGEYMRLRDLEHRYLPASVTGDGGGSGSSLVPWLAAVAGVVLMLLALRRRKPSPPADGGGGGGAHAGSQPKQHAQAAAHAEPDEKTQELARTIRRFMETSPEIYGQDFSLDKLAAAVGAHTRMVSRTVNDVFGVNFSTLLSQYRIKEACRRLSSPEYANVTIQSIAVDMGFKSRTNFAAVFKRETGLTPNEYQKEALRKAYRK